MINAPEIYEFDINVAFSSFIIGEAFQTVRESKILGLQFERAFKFPIFTDFNILFSFL